MQAPNDARLTHRSCTIYKPARVDIDGRFYLALMTDISDGGAGLVCPGAPAPGSIVYVATGDDPLRRATVVWCSDDHFGVRFDEDHAHRTPASHGYRSVRVPTDIPANLYVQGVRKPAHITNISPRGVALECDVDLPAGAIVSLEAGGQVMENVTIRWSRGGRIGARLPVQVKLPALQQLIHAGARHAARPEPLKRAG